MRSGRETPAGITFTGRLYHDELLLSLAHAYQTASGVHLRRPPLGEATPDVEP
jgi:Asp-tRNA(Asn)/Glu-tRNA(Gln) amidotransferase A subunit family amidase